MHYLSLLGLFTVFFSVTTVADPAASITFDLTAAQAKALENKGVTLAKAATRDAITKVSAEWKSYETPNFVHPPAFTYKAKAKSENPAIPAVVSAILADDFVKKQATRYRGDLKRLRTVAQIEKATGKFYAGAGFGKFEESDLRTLMRLVPQASTKIALYGGEIEAQLDKKISYGANIVLIVDSEKGEITGLGHGDLLGAFEETTDDGN